MHSVIPARGERAILVGQTGSGKTTLACWLIQRLSHYPRVIIDAKIEPKFAALPSVAIVTSMEAAIDVAHMKPQELPRHIVVRPEVDVTADPEAMDAMLALHYRHGRGTPLYIDEAYQMHESGRAGPGLIALLTRGRSRGITTIMSTQRPSWLSRFCFTESQRFFVLRTIDRADRKRLAEVTPYPVDLVPPKHYWGYWDADYDEYQWYRPVKAPSAGYHDEVDVSDLAWL